jgi:hypothetical protein
MRQADRFHLPLQNGDTAKQTVSCRHTNPDACAKHSLRGVCAFVRDDRICCEPPKSWPKQYLKLKGDAA